MTKKQTAIQALNALYLELPESIANDVKVKVMAAFEEQDEKIAELESDNKKLIRGYGLNIK